MAIPTDIKERTAADLSAAANDFLSRMAKLGLTASGFLPGLARGMIKASGSRTVLLDLVFRVATN